MTYRKTLNLRIYVEEFWMYRDSTLDDIQRDAGMIGPQKRTLHTVHPRRYDRMF